MKRHKSQLTFKDRNKAIIFPTEANVQSPTRQLSPQSPKIWSSLCIQQSQQILPIQQDAIYQAKIKELLEENQKLAQQNTAQDRIINTLRKGEQFDQFRSCRINTLTNIGIDKFKLTKIEKPIMTRQGGDKEEKMLFTFFSPDSRPRATFKLPKVFQIMPQKKKYFV